MPYLQPATYDLPFASGSATSEAAARKAHAFIGKQGRTVWEWVRSCEDVGCTQREASEVLGIGRPSACARFHALEQQGLIRKSSRRRENCCVYQAT